MRKIWKIYLSYILLVCSCFYLLSISIPDGMYLNPCIKNFEKISIEGFIQLEGFIHQDYNNDGLLDMFLFGVNQNAAIAYARYDNPLTFNIRAFECEFDFFEVNFVNVNYDQIIDIVSFDDYSPNGDNINIYVFDTMLQDYVWTQCLGNTKGKTCMGDYDHDGDDDILLYEPKSWNYLNEDWSKEIDVSIYKNNSGIFVLDCQLPIGLNNNEKEWVNIIWKDVDNDIDLDILAWTEDDTIYFNCSEGQYYRNDTMNIDVLTQTIADHVLNDNSLLINQFIYGSEDISQFNKDFDLDGDLDYVNINDRMSFLQLNNQNKPNSIIDLKGIYRGRYNSDFVRVEDFDYDGYPDILLEKGGTLNVPEYYEERMLHILKNMIPWNYATQSYLFAKEYFNSLASLIGHKYNCKYVFNLLQEFESALEMSSFRTPMIAERDSLLSYVERPRGEFESNVDFKNRTDTMETSIQEIMNLYQPKIKMEISVIDAVGSFIDSLKYDIANKSKTIVHIPFEIVGDYNPELERFSVCNELTNPSTFELEVPISKAKAFKEQYKRLSISALRQINIEGEYIYSNLSIADSDSTLYEISEVVPDWWNTNISDQYENSKVALEALTSIYNVYTSYKQTRGTCTLDLAKKDAQLREDAAREWSYSIIGSPPQIFVATSTKLHSHGEGKKVWFDVKQKKFHGYLVDDLAKP